MTVRQQIIKQLDKPFSEDDYQKANFGEIRTTPYSSLKQSIELDWDKIPNRSDSVELEDRIDGWFKGVINSLYYRPNKLVLVLEGENIDKYFFLKLFPLKQFVSAPRSIDKEQFLYNTCLMDIEFTKQTLNIALEDNFKISEDIKNMSFSHADVFCDKRLASYCSITNKWSFPQRKNFIIVPVKKINFYLFNSIPKELLWIEIFNKFKPEL